MTTKTPLPVFPGASPDMYQKTIDAIEAMIHVVDRDLKILLVNHGFFIWTKQLGFDFPDVKGRHLFDLFPFLTAKVREEYASVFDSGEPLLSEETNEINGQRIFTETKKIPIVENGFVAAVVTMVTDVTSRRENARRLEMSEEKFRLLFEQSNDAIFLLSPEGTILDCNQKTFDLLGQAAEEVVGMLYEDFVAPEYLSDSRDKLSQLKSGEIPSLYEKEFVGSDGRRIPVEINPVPVLDRHGKIRWIQSVVRDITERKRASVLQQILYDISDKTFTSRDLQQLYGAIHDILGRIINVNNFYIAIYDADSETLSFPYFIDEFDAVPVPKKLGKGLTEYVLRTHQPLLLTPELSRRLEHDQEIELIGTDCVSWLGIPLIASQGGILGVLVVQSYSPSIHYTEGDRDLLMFVSRQIATAIERKKTEETLHETEIQFHQLQKVESLGTLVGTIAHDYNNILTSILGNAQMLDYSLDNDPESAKKYIRAIIQASGSAAGLVKQLLDFTKEEEPVQKNIDINKIIREWNELLLQVVGDGIEIVYRLSPSVHTILGNPDKVRQVVLNLVINARDAMPTGGTLTITTQNEEVDEARYVQNSVLKAGSHVLLTIEDTGKGMDSGTIGEIFKPFFSTKHRGQGTGLGLSIVKRIVDEMGGVIVVSSQVERGTSMGVYLPHRHTSDEILVKQKEAPIVRGLGEVLLLVEDDEKVRSMLENLLRDHLGYTTLTARNGREALEVLAAESTSISLVITDLRMPDMDGVTLLASLKAFYPHLHDRIIAITAYAEDNESHLIELGFRTVLQKPLNIDTFSAAIRLILEENRTAE